MQIALTWSIFTGLIKCNDTLIQLCDVMESATGTKQQQRRCFQVSFLILQPRTSPPDDHSSASSLSSIYRLSSGADGH